jgi:hypothetical protein
MAAMKGAEGKKLLDSFVREMPAELEALRAEVQKAGRAQLLPLDRSYESLDRLEDFLALVLDKRVRADVATVQKRCARYVGATACERAGAKWALASDDDFDPLAVTGFTGAPAAELVPAVPVAEFADTRRTGWLRDATERFDLPLQRRLIAAMVANRDGVLAELRADMKQLLKKDPGPLDGKLDSLTPLYDAVLALDADTITREQRRKVRREAIFYYGCVLEQRLGKGEWSVDADAGTAQFGYWTIFKKWPELQIDAVGGPRNKPDSLRAAAELVSSSSNSGVRREQPWDVVRDVSCRARHPDVRHGRAAEHSGGIPAEGRARPIGARDPGRQERRLRRRDDRSLARGTRVVGVRPDRRATRRHPPGSRAHRELRRALRDRLGARPQRRDIRPGLLDRRPDAGSLRRRHVQRDQRQVRLQAEVTPWA